MSVNHVRDVKHDRVPFKRKIL